MSACEVIHEASGSSPGWIDTSNPHDWRLIDEKPHERERSPEELAEIEGRLRAQAQRLMGDAWSHEVPSRFVTDGLTVRRWYCTRCRTIETTLSEDDPSGDG